MSEVSYYELKSEEVLKQLNSSEKGLLEDEVKKRVTKYGTNELQTKSKINPFIVLINQFKSFIIYILIFAIIFSLIIGEYVDSMIILAIVIINAVIGFFQEYNAEKSLEALKKLTVVKAKVYRDGNLIKIDSKYLVPGDIIFVESGDKIPADARIIEQTRLKVDESSLTGESVPVNKTSEFLKGKIQLGDQANMLFSSTNIVEGTAKAVIVNIGMSTEIGKITNLMQETKAEMTPLQKRLDSFGKKLGYAIILICIVVFAVSLGKDFLMNGVSKAGLIGFLFIAISLAVAAVPTALPAVVTIALSIGVKRLLKRKCLVKNLASVETLGSCDVICTDKTGTLTKNEMTVTHAWTLDDEADISGIGYSPDGNVSNKLNDLLFRIGLGCNNASLYNEGDKWKISGDPTEAALIVSARKAGVNHNIKKNDELPFDSARKLMSVLVDDNGKQYTYTKGAPDKILTKCKYVLINNKKVKLTKAIKDKIARQNDMYASNALRVLAFAYKESKGKKDFSEEELIFVGLQAMFDPPRKDVIESIRKTRDAGIRVIMITGDYQATARAIAYQVGIEGNVLTGEDIEGMNDNQLEHVLKKNTNIFARVVPEHKQRIVTALQKLNYTVAMTGDGVNDAPALKKANIGVAVGSGTDVAKEASDFVLLDDSFTNIVNAIEEGRGIYDNIQKSIMLLLSGNVGEVLIIFLGVLFFKNLPLTAILLLWINLITDGAPALAYSVDPYGKDIMKRKPKPHSEGILPKSKAMLIFSLGVIGTLVALVLFYFAGGNSPKVGSIILAQTIVFNFVVLYEVILVFVIRRDYGVKLFSNIWLWGSVVLSLGLQALLMYTPLRDLFKITALLGSELLMLLYGAIGFYILSKLYYYIIHKKIKGRPV